MRYGITGYYSGRETPKRPPISNITFSTGFAELDDIFKFYPGQFVVLSGTAGHGKSTFMLNVLLNVANEGRAVFCFIPENETYIESKMRKMWRGSEEQWNWIWGEKFFFQYATPAVYDQEYDAQCKDIVWVLDCAKRAIEKDKIEVVYIDPWNELERACPRGMAMSDFIVQALAYVKNFCRNYNVTVIMVAHPTKEHSKENREPKLYDCEGSAAWKNKADSGLICVRLPDDVVKIKVEKIREEDAGKSGTACFFSCDPVTGIFTPQYGASGPDGQSVGFAR